MSDVVNGLQPSLIWKHFASIAAIPRPSKHEQAVARYVEEVAKRHGVTWKSDRTGNLLFSMPASQGKESAPLVCMQGHLDMICEKNSDTDHDFNKDSIKLQRDGDRIKASGTSLGADNGLGLAAMLAVMEDSTLEHGPLEFLLTVEEEIGLIGAKGLDSNLMTSKILLNLDSEEEGALYIGCSGGRDTIGSWDIDLEDLPEKMQFFTVTVRGLRGGHSGLDIDKQRANAIKILGRLLMATEKLGMRIANVQGGNKRNAIPRESSALLCVPVAKWEQAQLNLNEVSDSIKEEFHVSDPLIKIEWTPGAVKKGKVLVRTLQKRLIRVIDALPHGVLKMSLEIPGLVQTSTNLGVLTMGRKAITIGTNQRSSSVTEIKTAAHSLTSLLNLGGATVDAQAGYPGWQPNLDSPTLKLAVATYQSLFAKEPTIKAIHAGLECGIISEKYADVDMISFGPTIEDAHSPDESVYIPSVERFWNMLRELIRAYSQIDTQKLHS